MAPSKREFSYVIFDELNHLTDDQWKQLAKDLQPPFYKRFVCFFKGHEWNCIRSTWISSLGKWIGERKCSRCGKGEKI